jgi:aspartyl-tRNA(Asn)/glutamyl-tRNA(Gln) amidotransferase subunit C
MSAHDVDMEHLERLARLQLEPDEADLLARDVAGVLDYFDQLAAVDTDGVDELVRPVIPARSRRPDVVTPSLDRERVADLTNASQDGFVRVPRTVDED